MDNPWGTSDSSAGSDIDPWAQPKAFGAAHDDSEADLAIPSWSTSASMQWNDPPEAQGELWRPSGIDDAGWTSSTYDGITLGSSPTPPAELGRSPSPPAFEQTAHSPIKDVPHESLPPSASYEPVSDEIYPASSQPPVVDYQHAGTTLDSADVFGTFSGDAVDDGALRSAPLSASQNTWSEPNDAFSAGNWGDEWASHEDNSEDTDVPPIDEWEAAKLAKQRQDARVPPEVLAALLRQCEEACQKIWPPSEPKGEQSPDDAPRSLEDIPSLVRLLERLAPDSPPVPAPLHFNRTQSAKEMAGALKLTRNLPINRNSPLAHFVMASKGSSSWEASLKAKPETTEDPVPVGWRIVEKKADVALESSKEQAKGKGGGLLSFWSRRASSIPPEAAAASSSTPPETGSPRPASPRVPSPRNSIGSRSSIDAGSKNMTSPAITTPPPAPSTPPSRGPDFFTTEDLVTDAPAPAPTAVSRFLNRFSRAPSGSRKSVSLSAGDLDFLNEVPSAADDHAPSSSGAVPSISSLEAMIKSEPIFAGPLPPALPPPPKTTLPIRTNIQRTSSGFSGLTMRAMSRGKPADAMRVPMLSPPPSAVSPASPTSAVTPTSADSPFLDTSPLSSAAHAKYPAGIPNEAAAPQPLVKSSALASFADEDDFDDFQAPASVQASQSAFADFSMAMDQPTFGSYAQSQSMPSISTSTTSSMGGLLTSVSGTPGQVNPFPSFSSASLATPSSSASGLASSSSDQPLARRAGGDQTSFNFDDFDDFVSSPLRSPSPPKVPAKPQVAQPTTPSSSVADIDVLWASPTSSSASALSPSRAVVRSITPVAVVPPPGPISKFRGLGASELPPPPETGAGVGLLNHISTPRLGLAPPVTSPAGSLLPTSPERVRPKQAVDANLLDSSVMAKPPRAPAAPSVIPAVSASSFGVRAATPKMAAIQVDSRTSSPAPAPVPTAMRAEAPLLYPPPAPPITAGSFAPPKIALRSLSAASIRAATPAKPAPHARTESKVDHNATLGLLETANARHGTWPAPHSPLPAALAPPPGHKRPAQHDILDFSEEAFAPAVLPPPASDLLGFDAPMQVTPPPAPAKNSLAAPSAQPGKSGLSSQDLLFFDSL